MYALEAKVILLSLVGVLGVKGATSHDIQSRTFTIVAAREL